MIFARLPVIIRRTAVLIVCLATPAALQAAENDDIPRTAAGRADFNGIWQAIGSAHYDIEPHAADFGPLPETGAIGAIPAGLGIIIGGEIPYTPEARAQQQANKAELGWRWTRWSNAICRAFRGPIICRFRSRLSSRRSMWFSLTNSPAPAASAMSTSPISKRRSIPGWDIIWSASKAMR